VSQILAIFGPVPGGKSPLDGFFCLATGLLGLLFLPSQIARMDFRKQWPKLVLEVIVLLFLISIGLVMVSKRL
jgi:hypothetical protein